MTAITVNRETWLYDQTTNDSYTVTTGRLVGPAIITQHAVVEGYGEIESGGGLMNLVQGVSGDGFLETDPDSTMQLSAASTAGEVVNYGTLQLIGYAFTVPVIYLLAGSGIFGNGQIYGVVNMSDTNGPNGQLGYTATVESHGGRLLLQGSVVGSGTLNVEPGSTMELAGNVTAELLIDDGLLTLDGGTIAISFADVAAGATMSGFGLFQHSVTDDGTIIASHGRLSLAEVIGSGQLQIAAGATLELTADTSLDVAFLAGGVGSLALDLPADVTGAIGGLTVGNSLIFKNEALSSASITGSLLTVTGSAGTDIYHLTGSHGAAVSVIGAHTVTVTA